MRLLGLILTLGLALSCSKAEADRFQGRNGWWEGDDAVCETLLKTVEFTKNYVRF